MAENALKETRVPNEREPFACIPSVQAIPLQPCEDMIPFEQTFQTIGEEYSQTVENMPEYQGQALGFENIPWDLIIPDECFQDQETPLERGGFTSLRQAGESAWKTPEADASHQYVHHDSTDHMDIYRGIAHTSSLEDDFANRMHDIPDMHNSSRNDKHDLTVSDSCAGQDQEAALSAKPAARPRYRSPKERVLGHMYVRAYDFETGLVDRVVLVRQLNEELKDIIPSMHTDNKFHGNEIRRLDKDDGFIEKVGRGAYILTDKAVQFFHREENRDLIDLQ